jgi:transposase
MFLREKPVGKYKYVQIVESYRDGGRVRQRVLLTLGRLDQLRESGQLDALVASGARLSQKLSVIGAHKKGELSDEKTTKIGPGRVFGRLWEETGIADCLRSLLGNRLFEFPVEAAIFMTVVHRLMDPGSDRAAERWRQRYQLFPGVEKLDLHHLYRAMAWLGEPLPDSEQQGQTHPLTPRCVKDLVEEQLFARRRTLFSQMVVAFFDTTSIYFEGEGGDTIGERGKDKDGHPELKQMVVGLVLDGEGHPICCEMWPGNTADVTTLLPVVERLRTRFHVTKIMVVADRGMISKKVMTALEGQPDVEYILGARMRSTNEVNQDVLGRPGRYHVVTPERQKAKDPSPLKVKEVLVKEKAKDGTITERRYVVCYNPDQARKDREDREKIVAALREALNKGEKSLVGNKGFRKFLKTPTEKFEIDEEKMQAEARLDGKWVLKTNNRTLPTADVALTYKQLWMVEAIFRSVKSLLATRPVFHKANETIRGHVFCSFLSLILMKELQERMLAREWDAEWAHVVRDLDDISETQVRATDGKQFILRSEANGWSGKCFQAVGVALPPTLRLVEEER